MQWRQRQWEYRHGAQDVHRPLRQSDDLAIEALDDELLVYDRRNQRAHCLSATAARVWRACDGGTDLAAMSEALGLPLDEVRAAVEELEAAALLDHGLELVKVGSNGGDGRSITRRDFAARSAKVGTAVATAPLILSVAAPAAAQTFTGPSTFSCELYSAVQCGTNVGCGLIPGCCCCTGAGCQGPCNACANADFCKAGLQQCGTNQTGTVEPGTSACSTEATAGPAPTLQGCCRSGNGVPPQPPSGILSGCGCVYAPNGVYTTGPGGQQANQTGCCHANQVPPTQCSTDDSFAANEDCFPCCLMTATPNSGGGTFKAWIGFGSDFGCCGANTTTVQTCVNTPPPGTSAATTSATAQGSPNTPATATGTDPPTAQGSPPTAQGSPNTTTATTSPGATTARCVVPNLRGKTLAQAFLALNRHQCTLGHVKHRRARKRNRGRVIAQSARPGRTLRAGHAVAVTIGKK